MGRPAVGTLDRVPTSMGSTDAIESENRFLSEVLARVVVVAAELQRAASGHHQPGRSFCIPYHGCEIRVDVFKPSPGGGRKPLSLVADPLTDAEHKMLRYLATYLTFRGIADRLHLSRHTVKSHVMAIYRKLGVTSRTDAVEEAIRLGLLPDQLSVEIAYE